MHNFTRARCVTIRENKTVAREAAIPLGMQETKGFFIPVTQGAREARGLRERKRRAVALRCRIVGRRRDGQLGEAAHSVVAKRADVTCGHSAVWNSLLWFAGIRACARFHPGEFVGELAQFSVAFCELLFEPIFFA